MTKTLFRRAVLAVLATGLLWAGGLHADRAVPGYTLVPVTAADATAISITRQSDGQGGQAIVVTWTFEVLDSTGAVRYTTTVSTELTPAQKSQLATFTTNVGVPLANDKENL